MTESDGSDKRDALARRRTIGRIRTATVYLVLGCLLGSGLTAILVRPSGPSQGPDHSPPFIVSIDPVERSFVAAGNVTFRIEFSEPLLAPPIVSLEGTQSLSFADESFHGSSWQGVATIPRGADGEHRLTVTSARDRARNAMPDSETPYTVDTASPIALALTTTNRTSDSFPVTWNASDGEGSGVAHVELWSREGTSSWTPLALELEAIGTYQVDPGEREATLSFCAVAVDRAGNADRPCGAEAIVEYDATPPSALLLPRSYWATGPVDLSSVAANDATFARLCHYFSRDNLTWQGPLCGAETGGPFKWTFAFPQEAGHYQLFARGRDARGWIEPLQPPSAAEVALGLDREAPVSRIDSVATYWHSGPVTLFANASDDESGVASVDLFYTYRPRENADWSDWTLASSRVQSPWTFPFDFLDGSIHVRPVFPFEFLGGDGRYEFATRARDWAGRQEALPPIGQGDVALAYNHYAPEAAKLSILNFVDPATRRTNATWTALPEPAPDIVRFQVHRGTSPMFIPDAAPCENSETCVASLDRDGRSTWVPLPQENATYYVRVRTIDDGGLTTDGGSFGAVFHGAGFDTPDVYAFAAQLPLGVAWSERLQYADQCLDCADAFRFDLQASQSVALSLGVPSTGDFRLLVLDSHGNLVVESKNPGFGIWESVRVTAPKLLFSTYYVIVDWSNVAGPNGRNEGWYTLASELV